MYNFASFVISFSPKIQGTHWLMWMHALQKMVLKYKVKIVWVGISTLTLLQLRSTNRDGVNSPNHTGSHTCGACPPRLLQMLEVVAAFATCLLCHKHPDFWFRKKAAALSRLETGIDCAVGAKHSKRLRIEQKCQVKPRKVRVLREDSRQNCTFSADGRGGASCEDTEWPESSVFLLEELGDRPVPN